MAERRVFVTGIGIASPLGIGVEPFGEALFSGASGIAEIRAFDASALPVRVAAEVSDYRDDLLPSDPRYHRMLSRPMRLGLVAAGDCLRSAGIETGSETCGGVACLIAVGRHEIDIADFGDSYRRGVDESGAFDLAQYYAKGARALHPLRLLTFIPNIAVTMTGMTFGLDGEANAYTAEGAAVLQALGDGAASIREGRYEAALCGGCDARIDALGLARLIALGLLAEGDARETGLSMPFDRNRRGFVLGEGAAFLLLESEERAERRGARPMAEIVGWGGGADAHHPYRAHPEGRGLARSMGNALERAGVDADGIDLVVAAAASSTDFDAAEGAAIERVFDGATPLVTTPAGAIGRTGSASSAFAAATAVLSLDRRAAPPILNTSSPDESAPAGLVLSESQTDRRIGRALANGYAIGGQSASVLFGEVER